MDCLNVPLLAGSLCTLIIPASEQPRKDNQTVQPCLKQLQLIGYNNNYRIVCHTPRGFKDLSEYLR
jgi:hypothetical protein